MGGKQSSYSFQQSQEANFRHSACDYKVDCSTSKNTHIYDRQNNSSPTKVRQEPDQGE